jgi:hypothetical protein
LSPVIEKERCSKIAASMTPPITKELMASRPLYDPAPANFVARDVLRTHDLRRVRLSDFAVVAFHMLTKTGHVSKAAVDMFENVYVRGAKPRVMRLHEGQAALAPDGTVMSIGSIAYPGSSRQKAGEWDTDNVQDCPGYQAWLAQLQQSEEQMVARGHAAAQKNAPPPPEKDLRNANMYEPPQPAAKSRLRREPSQKAQSKPNCDAVSYRSMSHITRSSQLLTPKPHMAIELSTQTQYNSHITETLQSSSFSSSPLRPQPACENILKQEEHTQSLLPPLPNYQSLDDLHSSSSEPPDTDPASTRSLWGEVVSNVIGHHPLDALDIDTMAPSSSLARVPPKDYDPQGFSSIAFSKLLQQHQITIRESMVVPTNIVSTSFWAWFCKAVKGTPAEEASELEGCRIWGNNDKGTKAEVEELAARLKALLMDHDSALIERQRFITDQILRGCDLPGIKVYNNPKMLDVATEPYYLPPTRESPLSSISMQSSTRKSATHGTTRPPKPTSSIAQPINLSNAAQSRVASRSAAQPIEIDLPTVSKLDLPKDIVDYAYWLEASKLQLRITWIVRRTFVSSGTCQKTSPYLSIAFENPDCPSFAEKRLSVKHKIAVYGSTALYNRRLIYINASKISGKSTCIMQVERSTCDVHFGLAIMDKEATLYIFQCEENMKGEGEDRAAAWHGCSVSNVGEWNLTDPDELADMLHRLWIVADWARKVYVPVLQDDLAQLSTSFGY